MTNYWIATADFKLLNKLFNVTNGLLIEDTQENL